MDEADNADRIAVIDHGQTVALDTPENLRRMVGGDIITLKSSDDAQAVREIKQRYDFEVASGTEGITFEVSQGETFIPTFVSSFETPIVSINLRRPTLDDVFLKLTGRQIRDEEASAQDQMRNMMRGRGGMAH
jgi:ABC-2 type transport system ATP-binding protein